MLLFRLIVPVDRTDDVVDGLVGDARVTNVVLLPGAGKSPAGDLVTCDVTREAASDVLGWLKSLGLYDDGAVAVSTVETSPSRNARATADAAPGAPDDAIIWDEVVDRAYSDVNPSWSYYTFLTIATILAAVAVINDSAILVIGAMVVGPEFASVAAVAVGLAMRRMSLTRRAVALLLQGFAVAIAVTILLALVARWVGWVDVSAVSAPRPLTGFIWRPDRWSVVVALLAGSAGVLGQTAGRGNALVGVFISVTTVPAAGDLALSIALGAGRQIAGSAAQLGINLLCMTIAGVFTLLGHRAIWRILIERKRAKAPDRRSAR